MERIHGKNIRMVYRYVRFCVLYNQWLRKVNPVMHMVHKAGDKLFVDFAGEKLEIVDEHTGEIQEVEVFVAILVRASSRM